MWQIKLQRHWLKGTASIVVVLVGWVLVGGNFSAVASTPPPPLTPVPSSPASATPESSAPSAPPAAASIRAQSAGSWVQAFPAQSPSPRSDMGFVYDAERHVVVAFGGVGGADGNTLLDETWEYDGATWTQKVTSQTPGARRRPAIAYDPTRHVTVLFGGSNTHDSTFFNDTWEYDGTTWARRTVQNPPPLRNGAIMAYDPNRGRMLLFGGYCYTCGVIFYDDTWEYDGVQWTQLSPANHPSARETATMLYDPNQASILFFGGGRDAGSTVYNDTWEWNGGNWVLLTPVTSPPARWAQAMAYDQAQGVVVLFGGLSGMYSMFNDTWEYDDVANTWTQITTVTAPPARWGHGMAYNPIKGVTVLFGGVDYNNGYQTKNDTWTYTMPTVAPQRPVVLLPGFGGSRLYSRPVSDCSTPDEEIWLNLPRLALFPNDWDLQRLHLLSSDGYSSSSCDKIEAASILTVIRDLDNLMLVDDFYETLEINLADYGYQVTPCPYDWRRSIIGDRYTTQYQYDLPQRVDQCVEAARGGNPNVQVDIVAHSMGGLVARQYVLSSTERAKKVHTIVSLGTPYWGTPKAFTPLRFGLTTIDNLDRIVNQDRIKEIALNSPGPYQLLPSKTFFEQIGPYFASISPNEITGYDTYASMVNFLKGNYNGTLVDLAQSLHLGAIDDWRNDGLAVNYYIFAGTQLDTLRWVREQKTRDWGGGEKLDYIPFNLPGGGDGTVLEQSATLQGISNSFDGNATICKFAKVDHGSLTRDPGVWVKIDNALKGLPVDCPQANVIQPAAIAPANESRELIVESRASVHAWDEQGRHTGPRSDGMIEQNIPLVTYMATGEQTAVGLPPVSIYTITLQMTDTTPAKLKFFTLIPGNTLEEAISRTVVFQDVPSAVGGQATIVYNPLADPNTYQLNVDLNGDGVTDMVLTPTTVLDKQSSTDLTPPTTQIFVTGQQDLLGFYQGPVTITLQASDTGSGIYKVEYSLDGGKTGQLYTGPFTTTAEDVPTLYARSTDYAGNSEYPWAMKRLQPYAICLPLVRR